ncbi:three-Cys-motif partner protein TcmP [Mesorhizobium sp. B2-4-10]|uniref:three-Cys-motif partner protein TcmP n=1 Tax=Mesorhizobium sp. B2-4-10 TaxID=2589939 RepID=UPI0011280D4F|nr:three-Cys-motif partner protein TcmP [Mesorhizobium sp. B2-4-10]TPL16770.1 three-Cys-motif partner protein TcmP [Mesorhizobium sp. B2-4-10]
MNEAYAGREQTEAKHAILRHYLQELALITLGGKEYAYPTLTYVDGFSGPWQSRCGDYSDTSFMIALGVLKDVQRQLVRRGKRPVIKCFFAEKNRISFAQLDAAVRTYDNPSNGFHVETFNGTFQGAIADIMRFAEGFTLTFIDPTGWTEYPFDKIAPLLTRRPGEVLVNYMYDFAGRFTSWSDPKIVESFNGILRPGWPERIDRSLPPGEAAENLFRQEFKDAGGFQYAVSTPIKKLAERTHFCLTYGTRHWKGLEVYRSLERKALKQHDFRRFEAKLAKEEEESGPLMFKASELHQPFTLDAQTEREKHSAAEWLIKMLRERGRPIPFGQVSPQMLDRFALTPSEAKDVCVAMADNALILPTWLDVGSKRKKPDKRDLIILVVPPDGGTAPSLGASLS